MERREFDALLQEHFPGGAHSRTEYKHGWMDAIEIGEIIIEIAVLKNIPRGSVRGAGIYAYIQVKTETGGKVALWSYFRTPCNLNAARDVVSNLKKVLLGMAAAITQVCGFIQRSESPKLDVDAFISEPKKRKKPKSNDLDKIMAEILGDD